MQEFDTRIKLKSDTRANWERIQSTFKPMRGEMIIYYDSNESRSYCRIKIGDGETFLGDLPFIDADTVLGKEIEIVKVSSMPLSGSPDKLYINTTTNTIYHYIEGVGFKQVSHFRFTPQTKAMTKINSYDAGRMAEARVQNNVLLLANGRIPALDYNSNISVVYNIDQSEG